MAEETCEGYDCDCVHAKDDARFQVGGFGCNTDRHHHQEDIDIAGEDDGPRSDVESHGNILPLGLLGLYDRPLPISLRRWSGWRMIGQCLVGHFVRCSGCHLAVLVVSASRRGRRVVGGSILLRKRDRFLVGMSVGYGERR